MSIRTLMKHYFGLNAQDLRAKDADRPVFYEPHSLINGHVLFVGMSGTGKSFQSIRLLASACEAGIPCDIFDVHDELDAVPGSQSVLYSQATGYGFNPLVLDQDPHTGGVDRQAQLIVGLIKDVAQIGPRQEAALRNLIVDTYAIAGIFPDNRRSWLRNEIDERTHRALVEGRRFDELRNYFPTLNDLRSFATRKILALTIGTDNKAAQLFDNLQRLQKKLNSLRSKYNKAYDEGEAQTLEAKVESCKRECVEAYQLYIDNLKTGRETDDVLKYDSAEALKSLVERIDLLNSSGIFRSNPPPFGDALCRVHQIKSLTTEQQVLFVKLRLRAIFDEAKRRGPLRPGEGLRQIIFLDEAHKFVRQDSDDIINVIAKEARKFGLALWCASQQPTDFPLSFTTNVGATIILGISSYYWGQAARQLRITEEQLKSIRPKEVIAAKFQREGEPDPSFVNIVVPNTRSVNGRRAERQMGRAA